MTILSVKAKKRKKRKFLNRKKKELLNNIVDIVVYLHRVRLTGIYTYNHLSKVGKIHEIGSPGKRCPNYQKYGIFYLGKHKFTVFYNPIGAWLPQCILEISYPEASTFFDLFNALYKFNLSYVEYTIDLVINEQSNIRPGYRIMRRYLFFPYQKDGILRMDSVGKFNAFFRAGKIKFYERGDDELKGTKKWRSEYLDRIRIEYGAKIPDLNKLGIHDLWNFKDDPKFEHMLEEKFAFAIFKKSTTGVPSEYDRYNTKDEQGHSACFQNEYRRARLKRKNITQYMQGEKILYSLYQDILSHCEDVGKLWRSEVKMLKKRQISKGIIS